MKIERTVFKALLDEISRPEISILLGPRQVGKTFLLKELEKHASTNNLRIQSFNLEIPDNLLAFSKSDLDIFKMLTDNTDIIFIDEFHYLPNASHIFKAIFDSNKKIKIFASGSSSIEIHKHLKESLAGRRLITAIPPLTDKEYSQKLTVTENQNLFSEYLTFGGMPGLVNEITEASKMRLLSEILETYIQKDIKSLIKEENIRAFNTLLYLIAQNQGSLISTSSLASEVGLTAKTIEKYLSTLEQTFVCYLLNSYSKNLGSELKKSKKLYLYDLGIRNALLKDFGLPNNRSDKGIIYETYIFLQLLHQLKPNKELKFWRNKYGLEIDFIILTNRKPYLVEVKSTVRNNTIPQAFKTFIDHYPETSGGIVFSENFVANTAYKNIPILFRTHDYVNQLDELELA